MTEDYRDKKKYELHDGWLVRWERERERDEGQLEKWEYIYLAPTFCFLRLFIPSALFLCSFQLSKSARNPKNMILYFESGSEIVKKETATTLGFRFTLFLSISLLPTFQHLYALLLHEGRRRSLPISLTRSLCVPFSVSHGFILRWPFFLEWIWSAKR